MKKKKLKKQLQKMEDNLEGVIEYAKTLNRLLEAGKNTEQEQPESDDSPLPINAIVYALSLCEDYLSGCGVPLDKVWEALRQAKDGTTKNGVGITVNGESRWVANDTTFGLSDLDGKALWVSVMDGQVRLQLLAKEPNPLPVMSPPDINVEVLGLDCGNWLCVKVDGLLRRFGHGESAKHGPFTLIEDDGDIIIRGLGHDGTRVQRRAAVPVADGLAAAAGDGTVTGQLLGDGGPDQGGHLGGQGAGGEAAAAAQRPLDPVTLEMYKMLEAMKNEPKE